MVGLSTLLILAASPLLFGDEEVGWYLLSEKGEVLQRFSDFGGERAAEAAASPDGSTFAFVTAGPLKSRQLFLWRVGEPKARLVMNVHGYFASPTFSPGGDWLYFTHVGEGSPGRHPAGMNAQVFRVSPDGGTPEKLTESQGCKLTPSITSKRVYFLHSTCKGSASAEWAAVSVPDGGLPEPRAFGQTGWNLVEVAATRDGKRFAVVEARPRGARVYEFAASAAGAPRLLAELEVYSSPMRLQWAEDGSALFVSVLREIWVLPRTGKPCAAYRLMSGRPDLEGLNT